MPVRRRYADDYRGWPVAPRTKQHPVRGGFLDPRTGPLYHHGIDISVRDDQPEPGAPPNRSHKVYALEGGVVWRAIEPKPNKPASEGIVRVGHFGYGHVDPVVHEGDLVRPGQHIAWTVVGGWHLHLSEWFFPGGDREKRIPVNPLDRKGKIAPYSDLAPPDILDVRFFTPADRPWASSQGRAVFPAVGFPLDPKALSGLVDVRARVEDPQSYLGWYSSLPILATSLHPARVRLTVVRLDDRVRVLDRDVFRSTVTIGPEGPDPVPISTHFAPGTRQNLRAPTALKLGRSGRGELWFRLFASPAGAYWDTTLLPNGRYRLKIQAWDVAGNRTARNTDVRVAN
jgi:hypothetical protein